MSESLWTSEDPQPEDLDAALETLDGWTFERIEPNPDAKATCSVAVDRELFARIERLSASRGEAPGQLLEELVTDAERSAA